MMVKMLRRSLVCIICYPCDVHVQQLEQIIQHQSVCYFFLLFFCKCFVFRDVNITENRTKNFVVLNVRRLYNIASYLFRIFVTK